MADYVAGWIEQRENIRPRTKNHYTAILAHHITPTPLAGVTLTNLTPDAVRDWYATLLVDRPVMRSHAYGLLHAALATAVADQEDPDQSLPHRRGTVAHRKHVPQVLTVSEVSQLAEVIEARFKGLILVLAWCGLRWGEAVECRRAETSVRTAR